MVTTAPYLLAFFRHTLVALPRYALGAFEQSGFLRSFTALAMPAMIYQSFSNFVLPLLTQMAEYWNNQQDKQFIGSDS